MRRKMAKIERNILISIRYARILDEIKSAQSSILGLNDKNSITSLKKKKIEALNTYIDKLIIIKCEIEDNHKPKEYEIIIKDKLDEKLSHLSKQSYFEMIKYNFAIDIILDSSVDFKNSEDYFEHLSEGLFQDKSTIKSIRKSIDDIYWYFNKDNATSKAISATTKIPLKLDLVVPFLSKMSKISPKVKLLFLGFGMGTRIIHKKMSIRKMNKLSDKEFEYILSTTILSLQYAKKVLPEEENIMYFSSKLQVINATRATILKEFFEEGYDVKENLIKINSLKIFDNYLIEEMKCYI